MGETTDITARDLLVVVEAQRDALLAAAKGGPGKAWWDNLKSVAAQIENELDSMTPNPPERT